MNDKKFDVLLIYNKMDSEKVEILASQIMNAGFRVWLDKWEIIPGSSWRSEIERAISEVPIIFICIGPKGLDEFTKKEVLKAISIRNSKHSCLIIPILLPGSSPEYIPFELKDVQLADLRRGNFVLIQDILSILNKSKKQKDTSIFDQNSQQVFSNQINVAGNITISYSQPKVLKGYSMEKSLPHQCPAPPQNFVGRYKEIEEILAAFDRGSKIASIRGMGGIGKTTLALMLIEKLRKKFPDGDIFIDLGGTSISPIKPEEAMAHVIRSYLPSLKISDDGKELLGLYLSVLSDKKAIILLDNVASREQVEPLLPPAGCAIIITSRSRFILPGLIALDLSLLSRTEAKEFLLSIAERVVSTQMS